MAYVWLRDVIGLAYVWLRDVIGLAYIWLRHVTKWLDYKINRHFKALTILDYHPVVPENY